MGPCVSRPKRQEENCRSGLISSPLLRSRSKCFGETSRSSTPEMAALTSLRRYRAPLPVYRWIVEHAEAFPGWERTALVMMDESLEGKAPTFR
jgi:hypothetical protein